MSNQWIFDVETKISAIVKKKATTELATDYPNLFFTLDNVVDGSPVFPTVYIHFLPYAEINPNLDGRYVNAILSTVQVEITVDKSQGLYGARVIAFTVLDIFKTLGFRVTTSPEFVGNTIDTKRVVFRVQRTIGSQDTF